MTVILYILLGLLLLRLLLPYVALYFINRKLSRIDGYDGHIRDITLGLFRGSCTVHDIVVRETKTAASQDPLFTAAGINVLIQWKALFKKSIVATVVIEQPEVNLTKGTAQAMPDEKNSPDKKSTSLKTMLQNVLPFTIHLGIKGGTINYVDKTSKAYVDIEVTDLTVCIRDFSNRQEFSPAYINASAKVFEGTFDFAMQLYPMAEHLTFDINSEIKNINMVRLNEFFRAYAKIDVNRGMFDMYTEAAAKQGAFKGYVKPVIRDLDVVGAEDRNDTLLSKLWEGIVAGIYQAMKNKKEDQVAAKIPIEGHLDDPHINIFVAVLTIFQNAFFHAIRPSMDDVINMASVRTSVSKARGLFTGIFRRKRKERV